MKPTPPLALVLVLAACPGTNHSSPPDGGGTADAAACSAPTGFEVVEAVGAADAPPGGFQDVSLELSQYDEPMLAYVGNSGGDNTGSQLYFTMWDRASCAWRAPVPIDTVGAVATDNSANDGFPREVKLVQDGVSQHLAIAYERQRVSGDVIFQDVMLAQSSDLGMTWHTEVIAQPSMPDAADNTDTPSVGFSAGWMFVAYFQSYSPDPAQRCSSGLCSVIRLASRNGESGAFDDVALPPSSATVVDADTVGPEVAVGLDLKPSVVFAEDSSDQAVGEYVSYYYDGATHVVFDTGGRSSAVSGVDLAVDGETPYVAASADRTLTDDNQNIQYVSSPGIAGTSWSTPVAVPPDGGNYMNGFMSIARSDVAHAITIASDYAGNGGTARCGGPNLSTWTDSAMTWSTCGADAMNQYSYAGAYVTVKYARTGRRILAFNYATQDTTLPPGLVVWREP